MLSKEEDEQVDHLIALLELPSHRDKLAGDRVLWLAKKLKEINNECSRVHEELQTANQLYANLIEHYEG